MSRSIKKPIARDKPYTRTYHRAIRRNIKNDIKNVLNSEMGLNNYLDLEDEMDNKLIDFNLRNFKEIINDYDYSDWKIDLRNKNKSEYWDIDKVKRK